MINGFITGDNMEAVYLILFIAAWFVLNRFILPKLGVDT